MVRWAVVMLLVACGKSSDRVPAPAPATPAKQPTADATPRVDAAQTDAPVAAKIPCSAVVGVVNASLGPVGQIVERAWVVRARDRLVMNACEQGWDADARSCLRALGATASDDAINKCFEHGSIGFSDDDFDMIAENAKRIASARKRSASLTCKEVDKALSPEEECMGPLKIQDTPDHSMTEEHRERAYKDCLRDTHAGRLERCRVQRWPVDLRACIAALGALDADDQCFEIPQRLAEEGYDTLKQQQLGDTPVECAAYVASASAFANCSPAQADLDRVRADVTVALERWRTTPAAKRPSLQASCRAALDAVNEAARNLDCGL